MLLLAPFLACAPEASSVPAFTEADRRGIQLEAVRWLMAEVGGDGDLATCVDVRTLGTDGPFEHEPAGVECEDPDLDERSLLVALAADEPPALPREACADEPVPGAEWTSCSVVEESGQDALIYEVGCPTEPVDGRVHVVVSWSRCELRSETYDCTLVRTEDAWAQEFCVVRVRS